MGLVTGTLYSESLLSEGVRRSLEVGIARLGADIVVVPYGQEASVQTSLLTGEPTSFRMNASVEKEVAAIEGVQRASAQIFIASLSRASCCSGLFQLIAFDPETDFTITPWMRTALNKPLGKDELIVGSKIFQEPGDELFFYGHRFTVAGKLEPTGMGMDTTVFLPMEAAYVMAEESVSSAEKPLELRRGEISAVLVKTQKGIFVDIISSRILRMVKGVSVITASQLFGSVEKHFLGLLQGLLLISGIFWAVSTILIGIIFSLAINERRREIGLLRAMGARKRFVFEMVLVEAILLTFIGGALGVVGGGAAISSFSLLVSKSMQVPYLWPNVTQIVRTTVFSLAMAVLTGLLASFLPALVSSRMEPFRAIRMGE